MDTIGLDALSAGLLVRAGATALIVILIASSVDLFGPLVGGALAGLPIVIGPGFFFLLRDHDPDFGAQSAAYALLSLGGTQAFVLAYVMVARRGIVAALGAAALAWLVVALILSRLPPSPWLGLVLFVLSTVLARRIAARFKSAVETRRGVGGYGVLILRGLLAGLLVAGVTMLSSRLGAVWSGLLVAFPIGFTVIASTIQQRLGAATTIATLHAAMLGIASLAAFAFVLAISLPLIGAMPSILVALSASLTATAAAMVWNRRMPQDAM